jgi:hypothetical protein
MKASLAMLLKTNVGKMSDNRSLAMLMKPHELKSLSGDVDEKNEVIEGQWRVTSGEWLAVMAYE